MTSRWRLAFSPPAEVTTRDTGLRFTDILFGFVIREIFLRLQHWADLDLVVKCQLVVCGLLVLGSWIGFRRSVNRTDYEIKFVNLPLVRFVVDQAMIVFYFRVASLSGPADRVAAIDPAPNLAAETLRNLVVIFVLYVAWDILGLVMCRTKEDVGGTQRPKYGRVFADQRTFDPQLPNWSGLGITAVALMFLVVIWQFAHGAAVAALVGAAVVLLLYRVAKDTRTSWQSPSPPP